VQELGILCDQRKGYPVLSLYCPYWMINKTDYQLDYRVCFQSPICVVIIIII